jgi:hypothetical protein
MDGSTLQDLYDLKDCIDGMIKEVERLNKGWQIVNPMV